MHLSIGNVVATGLALASTASAAGINIHNWCNQPIYFYQSTNGGCDAGASGQCHSNPYTVQPGATLTQLWVNSGSGTSLKLAKDASFQAGILQFEYARPPDGLYWDLSDLDGAGAGVVGSPFRDDNVKVSPTGAGAGQGNCTPLRCQGGQTCRESFQSPDDVNTRWCPADIGDFWIDLCQPDGSFWN